MVENIDEYEFRVTKQIKGMPYKESFLILDEYLKDKLFLNIKLVSEIPSNEEGLPEKIYRTKPSHHELTDEEVETLKDVADDLFLSLRIFKLEEIV